MNNSSHEKRCDLRRLESYLSGECAPQEADTIERHLDNCETCRDAMRAQAAEPGFWKTATLNLDSRDDVVSEAEVTRSVREKPFTLNATNSAQESKEAVASATRRYLENWLDPSGSARIARVVQFIGAVKSIRSFRSGWRRRHGLGHASL